MFKPIHKKKITILRRAVRRIGGRKYIIPDFVIKTPELAQNSLFK